MLPAVFGRGSDSTPEPKGAVELVEATAPHLALLAKVAAETCALLAASAAASDVHNSRAVTDAAAPALLTGKCTCTALASGGGGRALGFAEGPGERRSEALDAASSLNAVDSGFGLIGQSECDLQLDGRPCCDGAG